MEPGRRQGGVLDRAFSCDRGNIQNVDGEVGDSTWSHQFEVDLNLEVFAVTLLGY